MLRLTLETDYALRMVKILCQRGTKLDAKTISSEMDVPARFALKILRNLSIAGIVRSIKGAGGGYIAARNQEDISLRDVIEAVEGPIYISRCLDGDTPCDRGLNKDGCVINKKFDKVNKILVSELEKITFDDIIKETDL